MPSTHTLLIAEGPHDVEFLARLLKTRGFSRIGRLENLPIFWSDSFPKNFPTNGDLLARHPVPLFLENKAGQSIALRSAVGITKIESQLVSALAGTPQLPDAVALVLDADDQGNVNERVGDLLENLRKNSDLATLAFPDQPGLVSDTSPRTGIYVMPDNQGPGTLEKLLLEAADVNYPTLKAQAANFVSAAADLSELTKEDLKEFNKPAGRNKAVFGAMTSLLKPGKAAQVSIQDNRWLDDAAASSPSIALLMDFLTSLLR